MENVKRMIGYTLLAGIAAFAQIAEAGPRRARKTVTPQRDVAGMAHQSEKDEDTMINAPSLITSQRGTQIAQVFSTTSDVKVQRGDAIIPVRLEGVNKMQSADRRVFLNNLVAIKEASTALERINKCMKDKGIDDFSTGQPLRVFWEDINGVLFARCNDPKTQEMKQFCFDKKGLEISPKCVGKIKRLYRYQKNLNILCAQTIKGGCLAVEIDQSAPCPTFTYKDSKGAQYTCLGDSVFVIEKEGVVTAYRGAMKELQREIKLQEKQQRQRL